jgi:hypothetical protein
MSTIFLRCRLPTNWHFGYMPKEEDLHKYFLPLCMFFSQAFALEHSDYAAWSKVNTDGAWTAAAKAAVKSSSLPKTLPIDIAKFCPNYSSHTEDARVEFWVGLLSAVARPESNFKPETTFKEDFRDSKGEFVISRGLLQISIESANQKKYACDIKKAADLHDPATNLRCGVRILEAWVKTDNVIATYGNGQSRGGGRYWSTLREKNKHLPELTIFTNGLNVCSGA